MILALVNAPHDDLPVATPLPTVIPPFNVNDVLVLAPLPVTVDSVSVSVYDVI
jgi:hypothetical protein